MRNSRLSQRQMRIGGASLVAVLMVVGAYILPGAAFPHTKQVNAALTDELLASYVAKDTDTDGLPDWQEALYGTDLNKIDTDGDGINDGEAVRRGMLTPTALHSQLPQEPVGEEDIPGAAPAEGSITDQFAKSFFEAYMRESNGQPMSEEAQQALVARLVADFGTKAARSLGSSYTSVSVHTNANITVLDYAGSVEAILRKNDVPVGGENPVLLMQALIENNDESARPKLRALADSYGQIVRDLLSTPTPPMFTDEHVALIRSFDELSKATALVAIYEKDPLGVLGSLSIYQPSSQTIVKAFKDITSTILLQGEPASGMPGALIVNIARTTEATP